MTAGNKGLNVDNPTALALPPDTSAILSKMFAAHSRVTITAELAGGFSGSRVFVIHPVRGDGLPELPAVVKLGPRPLIEQEWHAYREHVHNRLPGVAAIQGAPQEVAEAEWSGLRYPLVGSGTFRVESLESYYLQATAEALRYVLEERLFRQLGAVWRFNRPVPGFSLRASYDHLLPVNLLIRPEPVPEGVPVQTLEESNLGAIRLAPGDAVRLAGFAVTEVQPEKGEITLNLPRATLSYRVRLRPTPKAGAFAVGDVVDGLTGRIAGTRRQLLAASVLEAWGHDFDVDADTVRLPGGRTLPNPLARLPAVLAAMPTVRVAAIHGDLNPQNILVDPETREVRLIDFADARHDHILHDLLRLETGVVTRLLPQSLHLAGLPPEVIVGLYEELARDPEEAARAVVPGLAKPAMVLASIRKTARTYLFDPEDWGEYSHGLTLYLLGAHKYANLDATARKVAFLGAAITQQLLAESALRLPPPVSAGPQAPAEAPPPADFLPPADAYAPSAPATSPQRTLALPWWLPAFLVLTAFLLVLVMFILRQSREGEPEDTVVAGPVAAATATASPTPAPTTPRPTASPRPTRPPVAGPLPTPDCAPRGAGRSVVVLLDISHSMNGEKLTQAIAGLSQFVTCLEPSASIAVYTFNHELYALEPAGPVGAVGERLQQRLDVFAWGESALYDAVCYVTEAVEAEEPYSIIVLTDGPDTASTAVTGEDALLACIPPEARVHTIAYGPDADVELLERLADQGRGSARQATPGTIGSELLAITLP